MMLDVTLARNRGDMSMVNKDADMGMTETQS